MSCRCKGSLILSLALACGGAGGDDAGPSTEADTGSSSDATPTSGSTPETGATSDTGAGEAASTGVDACADSVVTWDNFGESFVLTWCTGCHHSALPSADRACAPCAVNFDTHAGVSQRSGLVGIRVLDHATFDVPPMPPAAEIPEQSLALLREWIECGAPGPETGQQGPVCPDPEAMVVCP